MEGETSSSGVAENAATVLHVLPHPGGGGETYVDALATMGGYRHERFFLTSGGGRRGDPALRGFPRAGRDVFESGLLHVHGEVAAALCLPFLLLRPSVVTLHGLHLLRRLRGWPRLAAVASLQAVVRAADRTICVAETELDELSTAIGPIARRRAVVVRNGVAPRRVPRDERGRVRAELELGEAETVAIWVGSLDERKDPLAAVHAAAAASIPLVLVGDGPLRAAVEQAAAAGGTRVLGQRADVDRLLAAADFFVTSSRREGLSFSLLEAMSAGLPAIVTQLPENLEAVGVTGIAVPCGDARALVDAFRRLAGDRDERVRLGRLARERSERRFRLDEMIRRTSRVYEEVLGRHARVRKRISSMRSGERR